jgi:hypothetical protein
MPRLHCANEVNDLIGSNGAHDAEFQRSMPQLGKVPGLSLGFLHLAVDLLQMGADNPAELRQVSVSTLAVEESAAQFFLELPDRPCQRRLSHMAALSRMGEVKVLAQGQEVSHLMHFHGTPSREEEPGKRPAKPNTLVGNLSSPASRPSSGRSRWHEDPAPRSTKSPDRYQSEDQADVRRGTQAFRPTAETVPSQTTRC